VAEIEDKHIIEIVLTPELFTDYKSGDYVVSHLSVGKKKKMTLLFVFNHEEYCFQENKTFKYPKMMLFNYVLSDEEVKQLAGKKETETKKVRRIKI